jgi:hypothetical protein
VRHDEGNETYWSDPKREAEALAELTERSVAYDAKLMRDGDDVRVAGLGPP